MLQRIMLFLLLVGAVVISQALAQVPFVEWPQASAVEFRSGVEEFVLERDMTGLYYCGSDNRDHYFLGTRATEGGERRWRVAKSTLVVVPEAPRAEDSGGWRDIYRCDIRADAIARYAPRTAIPWSALGREPAKFRRRYPTKVVKEDPTKVVKEVSSRKDVRTVYFVTDRAELAGLVDDLEHCAYYYPPLLASELHYDFARRNCEAARRSGPLTRDERRAMAEEDFELWTRLAVCAANLNVEGARRFADMMFDELLAKGITEKQELIYARYLACCPGREQQALDYVEELRKRGTSGELAYIAAWAKVWMGDADGAIKELQDRTEAESVALRGAVESNKASIQARSRYLVESRPESGK